MSAMTALMTAASGVFQQGFAAILRIDPGDGAPFDIDGRGARCVIAPAGELAPDCLWRADADTLLRIFEGGRALESAYLSGRLKIAGDMSVMARLVLESPR